MTHTVTVSFVPSSGPGARFSTSGDVAEGERPTRIQGTAFAVGTPSGPSADGHRYQFAALPENAADPLDVVNEHDSWADPIGVTDGAFTLGEDGQLVPATARIFDTTAGRDVLVLASEGVKGGFSIAASFDSYTQDDDGIRHVDSWSAIHLGVVRSPAFAESRGLTLAASAASSTTTSSTTSTGDTMPPEAPAAQFTELPTIPELAAAVAEFQAAATSANRHPLAAFSSHQEWARAFLGASEEERRAMAAQFAIPSQTLADLPVQSVPTWRRDMVARLDARRPAITAFGGPKGLPESGMKVEWPVFDGDLDALIAQQMAELDQLSGVRIILDTDSESILTAGAAATISYQAILRGTPSFLTTWQTIMEAAWARYGEARFETALAAKATDAGALPAIAAGAKPSEFKAQLFDLSAQVEDATGAPADVVLVSRDVWEELGAADLPNPKEGSQGDGVGRADASTLSVSINGLPIKRAPFLAAGTAIVSNGQAAAYSEQGPMLATEEDVTRLGKDVAIWGMYVPAEVYYPAGVLKVDRSA